MAGIGQHGNEFRHVHGAAPTQTNNPVHTLLAGKFRGGQNHRFGWVCLHVAAQTDRKAGLLQSLLNVAGNTGSAQPRIGHQ